MHTLLHRYNPSQQNVLRVGEDGSSLIASQGGKQILGYAEWTQAFSKYATVYAAAHPQQAVPLLKYMGIVANICRGSRKEAALLYDRVFRMDRQGLADPDRTMPWDQVSANAKMNADTVRAEAEPRFGPPAPGPSGAFRSPKQPFRGPSGGGKSSRICEFFNSARGCRFNQASCHHVHRCDGCGDKTHGRSGCKRRPQ